MIKVSDSFLDPEEEIEPVEKVAQHGGEHFVHIELTPQREARQLARDLHQILSKPPAEGIVRTHVMIHGSADALHHLATFINPPQPEE